MLGKPSRLIVTISVCAWLAGASWAAGRGEPGPVFPVRVELADELADLKLFHDLDLDIDGVFDGWARLYLIREELEKLELLGYTLSRLPIELPTSMPGDARTDVPSQYHDYASLTADLQQVAADHPAIAQLISIGRSEQGRELWVIRISDNVGVDEDEPEFAYISSMHGDEVVGKELCFNLIDYLTDNYGSDARVTDLVDDTEIWIMPSMNPDGTELGRRYNANWVDLNRDFPDQFNDPINTPAGRADETAAMMAWRATRDISLSANYHGGALVSNYPFDSNTGGSSVYSPSPDDDVFVSISRTYADNNPDMVISNGHASFENGICNGADWYAINGGMQDWSYVWHGGFDVTIEVSNAKWPQGNQLPQYWSDNLESMLSYLERVHEGLRGIVTDANTGLPLAATIGIAGSGFPTFADPAVGDYHRVLLPGTYDVEIAASGYQTALFENVEIVAGPALRLDAALQPMDVALRPVGGCVDTGGGCDGWLTPGQSVDLALTARNLGSAASGIDADVVCTGWYAGAFRPNAGYPDIAAGESGQSSAPHHGVDVDAGVPTGHKVGFALAWSSNEGSGVSDPFFMPVDPVACTSTASTDGPREILDRQTTSSTLSFPDEREITDVRVGVDVTHGYRSDLRLEIVSPAGTAATLHARSGGSADDIVGTYGVDLTSFESLSRFAGEASSGAWELRIADGVPGNTGTLNGWSLETCGRPFEAATPEMKLRALSRDPAGARLDWWPYPGITEYRVYRSNDPSSAAGFVDVTASDDDPSDTTFADASADPVLYYLVTGIGSNGEGPKGHFGE